MARYTAWSFLGPMLVGEEDPSCLPTSEKGRAAHSILLYLCPVLLTPWGSDPINTDNLQTLFWLGYLEPRQPRMVVTGSLLSKGPL